MTDFDINDYDINKPSILGDDYSKKMAYVDYVNPDNANQITYIQKDPLSHEGLSLKPYEKYLGTHLLPSENLDYERAEAQPWTEEIRNGLFNLPGSIIGGLIENVGYMGALVTEWGDDRDYSNTFTEMGKGLKDFWKSNVGGEIYRKNPNKVWDPMDTAWWVSHSEGLVESVGEFLITGYGIGSALGKGAGLLASTMKAGATTTRALSGAAQVGTAATLAYTEGAMSGAQIYGEVYKEIYEQQLAKLGNQTEAAKIAKHRAAQAAATTVQINTTINTLLNIGSVAPLFRSTDFLATNSVRAAGKKNAQNMLEATTRQAGDQLDDIIARTSNLQWMKTSGKRWLAGETVKEGIEEQVNLFAEQSGKRVGAMSDKEFAESEYDSYLGYFNQFKQLGNFAKDVFTEEGALNFVLGAFGGLAQSGAMRYLAPVKVVERNEQTGEMIRNADGTPKMKWTRSIVNERNQERIAFNRMQNSVVGDLKRFKELSTKLNDLVTSTDNSISQDEKERMIEDVRQELFDLEAYRSIRNGTADYLKGTFEYIGGLDNTTQLGKNQEYIDKLEGIKARIDEENQKPDGERDDDKIKLMNATKERLEAAMQNPQMTQAMYEGYAEKPNTDSHKKRSEIAIKEIDNYTKMYHDVMSRYNYGDEETSGLAETLFNLKLENNTRKRKLERNKQKIETYKKKVQENIESQFGDLDLSLADAVSIQAEIEALEQELSEIDDTADDIIAKKSTDQYTSYVDSLMKKYPTIVSEGKARGKSKKQIERQLIEKERYNVSKQKENINNKISTLIDKKYQKLKESFEINKVKDSEFMALVYATKSEEELNKELEEYIKNKEEQLKNFNTQLDNELVKYYRLINQDELDIQILMEEYTKLSSSIGRKEFVENGKAFFERIKAVEAKRQEEQKKEDEKAEAKKQGYFTIEETADGKFGVFDKNDKLIEAFDTEEEAIAKADELNKEIEEKKKKDGEKDNEDGDDKTDYDFKYRGNGQQHNKNLDFLNSLAEEDTEEDAEQKLTKVILQTNEPTLETIDNVTFGTANKQGSNDNNEDALYIDIENGVFVLADGMGGESSPVSTAASTSKDIINLLLGNKIETNYDILVKIAENFTIHQVDEFLEAYKKAKNVNSYIPAISSAIEQFFVNLKLGEDLVNKRGSRSGATALKATRIKDNTYEIEKVGDTVYFVVDKDGNITQAHGLSNVATTTGYMFSVRNEKPFVSNPPIDKFTITLNEGETLVLATDFIETEKAMQEFIASDFGKNLNFEEFQKSNKKDDSTFIAIEYTSDSSKKSGKLTEQTPIAFGQEISPTEGIWYKSKPTSDYNSIVEFYGNNEFSIILDERVIGRIQDMYDILMLPIINDETGDRLDNQNPSEILQKIKSGEYVVIPGRYEKTSDGKTKLVEKIKIVKKEQSEIKPIEDLKTYFSENTSPTPDTKYNPDMSGEGALAFQEQEKTLLELGADQIQAHGFAKGGIGQQFNDLLNILENGIDTRSGGQLFSAPLVVSEENKAGAGAALGTAGGNAYIDGGFIIIAKPGVTTIRSIDDIGGVLVNQAVADSLPDLVQKLKTAFPNLVIESYSNAPLAITELKGKTESTEGSQSEVDQEYQNFIDNGIITGERIKSIGEKLATNKTSELTDFENQILKDEKGKELVNEYLAKRKQAEDKKEKKSEYTAKEFIQKYLNYEFKDDSGKTYKLEFLDKYLDFLKLADANNTIIRVINDKNQEGKIFAQGNVITINVYHFNDQSQKLIIDDKILSELFVHETIHTFIGSSLKTNNAFFNEMKGFVLSMGNSNDLTEALDGIADNIKAQIRQVNKLEDSPEKVKKLNILKRALESINYSKGTILDKLKEYEKNKVKISPEAALKNAEALGLEEFIVLALSEPEFAFYLNTVPSDKATEDGPSMSMWQVLKKILFKILDAVLNNKSRLAELNNMLDKHLAKTTKGLDLINIQDYFDLGYILDKGIYTVNIGTEVRDVVILDMEGDNIIYTFPNVLSDPRIKYKMSKEEFYNGNPVLNENFRFEEFINQLNNLELTADNFQKEFERLKNQVLYDHLSIDTKSKIDEILDNIQEQIEADIKDDRLDNFADQIEKKKLISEIEGILNNASTEFGIDSNEFKTLSRKALLKIKEISDNINDIQNDNFIKLAKLTEFSDSFKHIFTELENIKEVLNNKIIETIKDKLSKETNLNMLLRIRNNYLKGVNKLKDAFNNEANRLKTQLNDDDYELQLIINSTNLDNIEERLEREFISRLSDDDIKNTSGVRYAQIIKDGKVNRYLYTIKGITETGYLLEDGNNKILEFSFDEVIDLSEKSAYYQGYSNKEEIFDEDYAGSILFDSVKINSKTYINDLLNHTILKNLTVLRFPDNPYDIARSTAAILNNIPNDIIDLNNKKNDDIKKLLKELINKAAEKTESGNYKLNSDQVEKLVKELSDKLIRDPRFDRELKPISGSKLFSSFLNSLSEEQRQKTNLGGNIRISVNVSTRANKLKDKMKSTSKDNIDEKLRLGLIKANTTKKEAFENNEEVIGIHMWEDISVDYEINVAREGAKPNWVRIGSARNPYAYKAIKRGIGGLNSTEVVRSPAHIYLEYSKETNQDEKNKLVDEFNNLYSVNNQPVDNATFEAIGKSWLKQKKLYDALSKKFKEQGDKGFTIEGDELSNIMSFSFTGGNFDFVKRPDSRKTLNQIAKEDNNNIELFKIETEDGVREFAVVDLGDTKSSEPFNRLIYDTVDGKTIEGVSRYKYLPNQKENYGRYWLVMKDVTGQLRFLWLKPRKAKTTDLNKFTDSINKKVNDYNEGKINKSQLENFVRDEYRKSIYLALPALPELNSINTFLNIEFNKDGKTLKKEKNKDGRDRYVFNLKIDPQTPTLSPTPKMFVNNLNLTDGSSFISSLFTNSQIALKNINTNFMAITEDNIRISFDQFEDMDKSKIQDFIMDIFEIPVNSNIYSTNRLLTNISDNITLEQEQEEELEFEQEEEDDLLSNLTEQEKELYYSLIQIDPYAANIINATKEDNFVTNAGNITPDNVSKKLGISKDQAKRSLQLLVDSGYLIKSGKYYKLNENFGIEEEFEAEEDLTPEEDMNLNEIKTRLLNLESDKFLGRSVRGKINEQEYKDLTSKLASNTQDSDLRNQVVDLLLQYYQEGKYTEIIDKLLDDTKLGKLTKTIEEDPDLIRKKLKGCPKG